MLLPLSPRTVESCLTLRRHDVGADIAVLCLSMADVSPNTRWIGERVLDAAAACMSQPEGGMSDHAQVQAIAVARMCLLEMGYRRSN